MRTCENEQCIGAAAQLSAASFGVDVPVPTLYTQSGSRKSKERCVIRLVSTLLRRFPFSMRLPYLLFRRVQARYTLGVAAVVLNRDGRILIVEHAYHPRCPWGLPGGWIDADEDPAAAVIRELREELQLEARVLRVVHASRTAPNHIDLAFLCEASNPIGKLSHELLAYRWAAREELPHLKPFHRQAIESAMAHTCGSDQWARA